MDQAYMKKENVLKLLITMALPMVISMLVNSLYNIVDSFFVAQISEDAMTAISLVFPMQNFINSVMIGFGIGINSVISFYMGAQDKVQADKAASQGILLATIHGIVMTAGCIMLIKPFLCMFTNDSSIVELGLQYSYIAFAFSTILAWQLVFEKTFQAVGRMTASMTAMLGVRAAVEEGIIAGGGSAYIHASKEVAKLVEELDGDEKTGARVVLKALEAPLFHISANAGLEGSVIINKVRESEVGVGFDAFHEEYVNMVEKGILDPTKVTRSALQNATSVAGTLLTTEAVVSTIKEETPAMPAGNPGMGMM